MDRNRQLAINLAAAGVAFAVNIGINFFLSPYIVRTVGVEAYGFWGLANNFINYATIITIALNSMAGRFLAIEVQRNDWKAANRYFSSIFFANAIAVALMLIPATLFVLNINEFIRVPGEIATDVKLLFGLIFINFFINMMALAFSLAPFTKNMVYLRSLRKTESSLLKAGLLLFMFYFFESRLWFLGLAALVTGVYQTMFGFYYTSKLLPDIKLDHSKCERRAIKELLSSGSWNVVNHLGRLLATGFDLLIANLFLGAAPMGVLALSRVIPSLIESMMAAFASVFTPEFTMLYAKNEMKNLTGAIRRSIKILGLVVNVPVAVLIAFGQVFFRLWVPTQDAGLLHILSVISVFAFVFAGATNSLFSVFIVTNRLRTNSLLVLLTGLLNVVIVILLLKYTELGLLAIAGVSTILITIRNLAFTVPFGAIYIGLPWHSFFPEVGKSVAGFSVIMVLGLLIQKAATIDSWYSLLIAAFVTSAAGFAFNLLVLLNASERRRAFDIVKKRVYSPRSNGKNGIE